MAEFREIPDISATLKKNLKRLPLILCQDISGSMSDKYELMNKELKHFLRIKSSEPEVCKRTDLTVIKFNHNVYVHDECLLSSYEFKEFSEEEMDGTTHLWGALDKALSVSEKYINDTNYWSPWILLYTDGFSNDEPEELKEEVIKKLQAYEKEHSIILFILGIGDAKGSLDALNINVLNSVSMRGSKVVQYAVDQEIDVCNFFQIMIRTITRTLSDKSFFVRDKNGNFVMSAEAIEALYDEYHKNIRNRRRV